jgi:hypothetical protein
MAQAVAKYWVSQIASSLIHVPDGISLSHGAMTQTRQLRKDEPHPVGSLVSISQLLNDLAIDLSLGVHEANEVSLSHRWCSKSAGVRNKKQTIAGRCESTVSQTAAAAGDAAIEAFHERGIFR